MRFSPEAEAVGLKGSTIMSPGSLLKRQRGIWAGFGVRFRVGFGWVWLGFWVGFWDFWVVLGQFRFGFGLGFGRFFSFCVAHLHFLKYRHGLQERH